jgi:toxin CcdB
VSPVARQFDVYRTSAGTLVVVIQSDLLDEMRTRVVAPLLPAGAAGRPMRGLNPEISFGEEAVVLMPQLLATLTIAELGVPAGSIAHMRDTVIRAVDTLLAGV